MSQHLLGPPVFFIPSVDAVVVPSGMGSQAAQPWTVSLSVNGPAEDAAAAVWTLWEFALGQHPDGAVGWQLLRSSGWRSQRVASTADVSGVLSDSNVVAVNTGGVGFRLGFHRDVPDTWVAVEYSTSLMAADALDLAVQARELVAEVVSSSCLVAGHVDGGPVGDPYDRAMTLQRGFLNRTQLESWVAGYNWVTVVSPPNALVCSLDTTDTGNLLVERLGGGSWLVGCLGGLDDMAGRQAIRELLWRATPVTLQMEPFGVPVGVFEGGPVGGAGRVLTDRTMLTPGRPEPTSAPVWVTVHANDAIDQGTVDDIGWIVDAWRRVSYGFRADSHEAITLDDWLPRTLTVTGTDIVLEFADSLAQGWVSSLQHALEHRVASRHVGPGTWPTGHTVLMSVTTTRPGA